MTSTGSEVQRMPTRRRSDAVTRRATLALHEAGGAGESVVVLGFDHVSDDAWSAKDWLATRRVLVTRTTHSGTGWIAVVCYDWLFSACSWSC